MKNFTNNFKQFTSRLSARWLIMALMLLLGTSSAWAVNKIQGNCDIYFDNSKTLWTDACIQFVIGHNSYSRTYVMTKQPDSNLYHVKLGTDNTNKWEDATYYAFIGTSSKWGDEGWGPGNITNAPHRTTTYTGTYDLKSGSSYYFVPTSSGDASKNGASFEIGTSYTQTYTVKKSESGTTGGTVQLGTTTLSTSDTSMDAGTYDLTITAPTGYNVSSVTVSGGSLTTAGTTGSNTYSGTVNVTAATTISVTYTCSPSTSIISAMLGNDGKINLKGNFNTCIQQWHGFQWRIKGNDWCQENIPNDNSGYVSIYTNVNGEDTGIFEPKQGKTYEFRTYIYGNTWVYSSETIEVSTCTAATLSWANTFTGNMKVGDEVSNPASLSDAAAGSITYESSDPSVIEVDGNTLRVLKSGTATITASATPNTGFCSIESIEKEVNVTCDVVNTEDIRIEVVCTSGDNPYIWAWEPNNGNNNLTGGEWPGHAMTPEGNNVYSWEAKPTSDQSVSIVISKDKDGSNQTNNIDGLEIGKRYKFSYDPKTTVSGSNNRYVYQLLEEDCLPPACVAPADPTISITPEGLCGEGTVTITVEDSHIAEMYQLYIVNNGYTKHGTAQKGKILTETPSKTTTYVVKALNGKCTSNYSNEVTLTVYAQPTITQTKNTICKGEMINLNDCVSKVPANTTLTWYSDDAHGTQLSDNALNVSPEPETTYYYQASIGGACTVDGSITLTVNDLPENVDFGTNNTASVCQNASVNLTTLSAWTKDGQTIQWYSKEGDAYTPVDANQTITADCTFYAKAIFNETGCESEGYSPFEITTLESPDAPFDDNTTKPICASYTEFSLTELSGWNAEDPDNADLTIYWYTKNGDSYNATDDIQRTITANTFYARTKNTTGCYSEYVALVIPTPITPTTLDLTMNPSTGITTPWIPIKVTVDNTKGDYEVSYPNNLNTVTNVQITKKDNVYTYRIPRPSKWETGDDPEQNTKGKKEEVYTVRATLTAGSESDCPSMGEVTIRLQDEDNDKCTWPKEP